MQDIAVKDQYYFIQQFVKTLYCPITKCIFYRPVVANDGFVYEESLIENWLTISATSPITGKPMSSKLVYLPLLTQIIAQLPKLITGIADDFWNVTNTHSSCLTAINTCISTKNYKELLKYSHFMVDLWNNRTLIILFSKIDLSISKHIIDNLLDLINVAPKIIPFVSLDVYRYLTTVCPSIKDVTFNLEHLFTYAKNNLTLHLSANKQLKEMLTSQLIIQLIKNAQLTDETIVAWLNECTQKLDVTLIVKQACVNDRIVFLAWFLKTDLNFNITDETNNLPIHYVCQLGNELLIKTLLRKKPALHFQNNEGLSAINILTKPTTAKILIKMLKNKAIYLWINCFI